MKKIIPRKNYFIIIGLIITILCACLASYNICQITKENNLNTSPLAIKKITLNDLNNSIKDIAPDTLLFISYTRNKRVHQNEKSIYKYLDNNLLLDNVMYLDITEEYYSDLSNNNEALITKLNNKLNLKKKLMIKELPAVIYYSEGSPLYTIDSSKKIINTKSIEKIVDNYMLEE